MSIVARLLVPTLTQHVFPSGVSGVFIDMSGNCGLTPHLRVLGERVNVTTFDEWFNDDDDNDDDNDDDDNTVEEALVFCVGFYVPDGVRAQQFVARVAAVLGPGFLVWCVPRFVPPHWTPSGYQCVKDIAVSASETFYVFKRRSPLKSNAFCGDITVLSVSARRMGKRLIDLPHAALVVDRDSHSGYLKMYWYSHSLRQWMLTVWAVYATLTRAANAAECHHESTSSWIAVEFGPHRVAASAVFAGACNAIGAALWRAHTGPSRRRVMDPAVLQRQWPPGRPSAITSARVERILAEWLSGSHGTHGIP